MGRRMRRAIAALCAMMLAGSAPAQQMADPMRPPATGATATPGGNAAAPAVQMIMIAPQRRYAVIDGYPVMEGGRVRDGRVVRIEETEVTLRGSTGETTVLKLLPRAHKKAAAPSRLARGGAPAEDEER
jgi:MSHA biogenesis protein MshK